MMRNVFEILKRASVTVLCGLALMVSSPVRANNSDGVFLRTDGPLLRFEYCSGPRVAIGWQLSHFLQPHLALGVDEKMKGIAATAGFRSYFGRGRWTAWADVSAGALNTSWFTTSALTGVSYKNWDFGVGGSLYYDGIYYASFFTFSVGWNLRFKRHNR